MNMTPKKFIRLPPLVAIVFGFSFLLLDSSGFRLSVDNPYSTELSGLIFLLAIGIDMSALIEFWRARTTINPVSPEKASSIVESGPYRFSRNPMYVGLVLFLLALIVYLSNVVLLIFMPLFVILINQLFIVREEKLLEAKFGQKYLEYKNRVRRWI